jgi:soluble lytic murein transglycosylase
VTGIENGTLRPHAAGCDVSFGRSRRQRAAMAGVLTGLLCLGGAAAPRAQQAPAVPAALTATPRPAIPASPSEIWLVPEKSQKPEKALADFANGVRLLQSAKYAEALPLLNPSALAGTPLAGYASYYTGIAYLNLARAAEARTVFAKLRADNPSGFLAEGVALREAETAAAQEDYAAAAKTYQDLSQRRTANPDAVLLALGRAQSQSGDKAKAAETFARLYYEFPLSDTAATAATELDGLKDLRAPGDSPQRFKLELGRAERLFGARRYAAARDAFDALRPIASGDDAEIVALRIAECDNYMKRYRQATDGLRPYLEQASRKAEAQFFYLTALRELGEHDEFVRRSRSLAAAYPDSSWAEEALNNLGTHYILVDDDDQADAVFRELYTKYPKGSHAERAAWKAGWAAYKRDRFEDAISFFEGAASTFPRSDYRPSFLYWSARARDAMGDKASATALLKIVATDYLNSYYGRLAAKRLAPADVKVLSAGKTEPAVVEASAETMAAPAAPKKAPVELIRQLMSLELYDAARDELLYAQRNGTDSPALSATLAWLHNKLGDYRRGIVVMKRAYPTYMSAEGANLPRELLRVIFPIDYWNLIRRYAPANNLDPFLVAALINQESSFLPDAKSSANAIGLMQLLPSTGRRWARVLKVRRYNTASLTRPEINIQLGTAAFAELIRRVGGVHYALACYNAGEHRLAIWTAERPGVEREEFIDDIPFPETQTYVKKILGTAEDYRRLYADGDVAPPPHAAPASSAKGKAVTSAKSTATSSATARPAAAKATSRKASAAKSSQVGKTSKAKAPSSKARTTAKKKSAKRQ